MSKDNAEVLVKLDQVLSLLHQQGERIARMEGRLDEQSRILSAMIPTTLAAVPSSRHQSHPPPAE